MFKVILVLLVSVFVVLAVNAPVTKPAPAPAAKPAPVKPVKSVPTLFLKPDTTLYFSANRDTMKMVKTDSIWITKHYIDSLFCVGIDTTVRSSKPVFIKK
jgi:hypothetical protein